MTSIGRSTACLALTFLLGCSLVNAPEDALPRNAGTGGSSSGTGGTGGTGDTGGTGGTGGSGASGSCGDGEVQSGEQCDDGGETAECDENCTTASCGDGDLNAARDEQCDDAGDSPECNEDCTLASCGDGYINALAGEDCEAGAVETAECDPDCTTPSCGDGYHNALAGEDCESSGVETAECDPDCSTPSCGDGYVNALAGEDCEAGAVETAECDPDCTSPSCGDGYINVLAGEECDDGNIAPGDGCSASCVAECPPEYSTTGSGRCQRTYYLTVGEWIGPQQTCEPGHYYNGCSGPYGFQLADVDPGSGVVTAITIEANLGIGCTSCDGVGTFARTVALNAVPALTYDHEDNGCDSCQCLPTPTNLQSWPPVSAPGLAAYQVGGLNQFEIIDPLTCEGFSENPGWPVPTAMWAVTVTY